MSNMRLFNDNPLAERQPKTDRLILERYLREAADDRQLDDTETDAAYAILCKWADFETSGRLLKLKETQLQGDFLHEVFGQALGYVRAAENAEEWNLEQHRSFGMQTPDAVLGHFTDDDGNDSGTPLAVVELKGPTVHVDHDRSNNRTAIEQCWDYLVNMPKDCRWGVVSNIVSFRLYERDSTRRAYEHFSLQSLRDKRIFRQFYVLFRPKGLIEGILNHPPRAIELLKKTDDRQRAVGDELYASYSRHRTNLIALLHIERGYSLDDAIEMAQRLFDRVMFIAFCEDRGLLSEKTIERAHGQLAGFSNVTNPRWQNFKALFRFVDAGSEDHGIPAYNGGLFATHAVDEIELPDEPWTNFFKTIGSYDFADEVNLDVLGHLFERSITELEKLKQSGLFGGSADKARAFAEMPQSAKRKRLGIYYTPPELTSLIVRYTVEELIEHRFNEASESFGENHDNAEYWSTALDILRNLKIVDPACGSGAFLFQAYNTLEQRYSEVIGHLERHGVSGARELHADVPHWILNGNLYGVDLSPEAVEITQLALWVRSATQQQSLATLSHNIVHGNSLVHDVTVHEAAFDWRERFPEVFNRDESGFDCVIGNPPWERMDLSEREFFSLPAPEIATATTGAKRRRLVSTLQKDNPALFQRFETVKSSIDAQRTYCHKSGEYPLTGKGRTNTCAAFAELALKLVAANGRVGLLTPSGIASDLTTKDFFTAIASTDRLIRLYDFENRTKRFFPDVDGRFKFCILNFGGAAYQAAAADFVFFVHRIEDLKDRARHVPLSSDDLMLLNPNTCTCPVFRSRRDARLSQDVYRRVPILCDKSRKGETGNPWGIRFRQGLFNQTSDSGLFREAVEVGKLGYKLDGNWFVHSRRKRVYLPLYEAKMVQMYDHRAASAMTEEGNWVRQGQTIGTSEAAHQNPELLCQPRYWIADDEVAKVVDERGYWLGYKRVTSATNTRTMIASMLPDVGFVNSMCLIEPDESVSPRLELCLAANLNAFVFDFLTRPKVHNVDINFFILEQLPVFAPDVYGAKCKWHKRTNLVTWISERVLKLSCTAEDMLPLAEACDFNTGSFKKAYNGQLHKWDAADRAQLMAELDAAFFMLYGIDRDDAEYILSTFKGIHENNPLLGQVSTAEHILDTYDLLCAHGH
ncbi:MAG: N-6 DNA methylase [Planctomycetes bacterium]|nr:N-6 DNA methylase [Planctomycetota bacterium]